MALENLFATEPTLPSMQKTKLPEDTRTWGEAITTLIKQKFPDLANVAIEIEFRRKDEPTGSAIGAASLVSEEAQKTLCLPLIIKRFEMSPLDIWMEKESQAVHPITPDTFREQFFSPTAAEGLDTRPTDAAGAYFNDPSTWTSTYPPLQGRYSYASAGYRVLDLVSDTMTPGDIAKFKEELAKHSYALPKFFKHGHKEILQKISAKKGANLNDFEASALKMIPMSVAQIKKRGANYSVLAGANGIFDLAESLDLNREACMKFLEKITAHAADVLEEVDQEGERMLVMPASRNDQKSVFLYDDMEFKPAAAKSFGAYVVKMKGGHSLEGVVLPNVVNFKGKKQSVKLFIAPEHASMQETIVGVENKNSTIYDKILHHHAVRTGQSGTFVFLDNGMSVATEPVTIQSIEKHGSWPITAWTLGGQKIKIRQGWSDCPEGGPGTTPEKKDPKFLDAHGLIEDQPEHYTIPKRMMWVPMERFQDVSSSSADWLSKEANVIASSTSVLRQFDDNVYELQVGETKISGDNSRVKFAMACLGAPLDVIDRSFKKVATIKRLNVYGLGKVASTDELKRKARETQTKLAGICDKLRCSLVKEAAEVEDTETVDAMLSLGFLNQDNLAKFISYRPVFEKCADYLAQVTLASRLGMNDVDESATTGAMQKMLEVSTGLKRVETAMQGENVNNMEPLPAQEQK
jgi:hypothetical protein